MIPPILHRFWHDDAGPNDAQCEAWAKTFGQHHPHVPVRLWSEWSMWEMLKDKYPTYVPFFESLKFNLQRYDLFRYILMYEYGGIYADWDIEFLKPLDPLLPRSLLLAYCTPNCTRVTNAILGSTPQHPFWTQVLMMAREEYQMRLSLSEDYAQQIMLTTSPSFFTAAVNRFLTPDVPLSSGHFFPFTHAEKETRRDEYFPDAYGKHHWAGSWSFEPVVPRSV